MTFYNFPVILSVMHYWTENQCNWKSLYGLWLVAWFPNSHLSIAVIIAAKVVMSSLESLKLLLCATVFLFFWVGGCSW